MKKTLMSLAVVSTLMSGAAMAAIGDTGQADNSSSSADLHFTGKVTSSLCQVGTSDLKKEISLGELSRAALTAAERGPSTSFEVKLVNCDPSLTDFTYHLADQRGGTDYLINKQDATTAGGVGVFIEDNQNNPLKVEGSQNTGVVQKDANGALPDQTIPLSAYIGLVAADVADVKAGLVDASATMTIRTLPVAP